MIVSLSHITYMHPLKHFYDLHNLSNSVFVTKSAGLFL